MHPNIPVTKRIRCPYCGEPTQILVDPSVDQQSYVEDCSVCCRPICLHVACDESGRVVATPFREDE